MRTTFTRDIERLLRLLDQAVSGPEEIESLFAATIAIRDACQTSVLGNEQCVAIIAALARLERATCFHLPEGCTVVRLQAGLRALGGLVRFWAEEPDRRGVWDRRLLLERSRYTKIFANDLENAILCNAIVASEGAFVAEQARSAVHMPQVSTNSVH